MRFDWGIIGQKDQFIQSKDHENVKSGKVVLSAFDYPGYIYLGYNQQRELFNDKRVQEGAESRPSPSMKSSTRFTTAWPDARPARSCRVAAPRTNRFSPWSSIWIRRGHCWMKPAGKTATKMAWSRQGDRRPEGNGGIRTLHSGRHTAVPDHCRDHREQPPHRGRPHQGRSGKVGLDAAKARKKEFDATIIGWGLSWKQDPFRFGMAARPTCRKAPTPLATEIPRWTS